MCRFYQLKKRITPELFFLGTTRERAMNPQIEKVVRVTSVVATAVVSYFLLTADYGPEPNALDPVSSDFFLSLFSFFF